MDKRSNGKRFIFFDRLCRFHREASSRQAVQEAESNPQQTKVPLRLQCIKIRSTSFFNDSGYD